MRQIADVIRETRVPQGKVGIFWAGQAGFVFKTAEGLLIGLDLYLSDYCERLLSEYGCGYKRMVPAPFGAEDLVFDLLLISHEHPDHLDADSLGALSAHPCTRIYSNATCVRQMAELGLPAQKLHTLQVETPVSFGSFTLLPVRADHGAACPDALGFILDFGFVKIYYAGDTAYHPELLSVPLSLRPEVALLPINGAFGNLDSREAAALAGDLEAKVLIPYHFWTFPLHLGNPAELISRMQGAACRLCMLTPGEPFLYGE